MTACSTGRPYAGHARRAEHVADGAKRVLFDALRPEVDVVYREISNPDARRLASALERADRSALDHLATDLDQFRRGVGRIDAEHLNGERLRRVKNLHLGRIP